MDLGSSKKKALKQGLFGVVLCTFSVAIGAAIFVIASTVPQFTETTTVELPNLSWLSGASFESNHSIEKVVEIAAAPIETKQSAPIRFHVVRNKHHRVKKRNVVTHDAIANLIQEQPAAVEVLKQVEPAAATVVQDVSNLSKAERFQVLRSALVHQFDVTMNTLSEPSQVQLADTDSIVNTQAAEQTQAPVARPVKKTHHYKGRRPHKDVAPALPVTPVSDLLSMAPSHVSPQPQPTLLAIANTQKPLSLEEISQRLSSLSNQAKTVDEALVVNDGPRELLNPARIEDNKVVQVEAAPLANQVKVPAEQYEPGATVAQTLVAQKQTQAAAVEYSNEKSEAVASVSTQEDASGVVEFPNELSIQTSSRLPWTRDSRGQGFDWIEAYDHLPTLADATTKQVPLLSKSSLLLLSSQHHTVSQENQGIIIGRVPAGFAVSVEGAEPALYIDRGLKRFSPETDMGAERYFAILNVNPGLVKVSLLSTPLGSSERVAAGAVMLPTLQGAATYIDFNRSTHMTVSGTLKRAFEEEKSVTESRRGSPIGGAKVLVNGDSAGAVWTSEAGLFQVEGVLAVGDLPLIIDVERENLLSGKQFLQRFDSFRATDFAANPEKVVLFATGEANISVWRKQLEGKTDANRATLLAPLGKVYKTLGLKQPLFPRMKRVDVVSREATSELYTLTHEGNLEANQPITLEDSMLVGFEVDKGLHLLELTTASGEVVWSRLVTADARRVSVEY